MQTAEDIKSALNNMKYYATKIADLSGQQLNLDFERSLELGINTDAGTIRFDCLGAIGTASHFILTYCNNIENNLKTAISQDKVLHINKEGD